MKSIIVKGLMANQMKLGQKNVAKHFLEVEEMKQVNF